MGNSGPSITSASPLTEGEVLGFLGPNGAGKTTLMRVLTCYFPPTSGKASVAGFDCFADSLEVRKRIGYLPERVPLVRRHEGQGLPGLCCRHQRHSVARDIKAKVDRTMADCNVDSVANKLIHDLSRGYRQRVGLAQALVNDPDILILDEPTVGLDPKQITEIRNLIKELAGKRTVILSTHILPEVSMLCGRVIIINDGKLVANDTPENLTAHLQKSPEYFCKFPVPPPRRSKKSFPNCLDIKGISRDENRLDDSLMALSLRPRRKVTSERLFIPVIVNKGWDLVEMRSLHMSLEDVFIKLITKEETQ